MNEYKIFWAMWMRREFDGSPDAEQGFYVVAALHVEDGAKRHFQRLRLRQSLNRICSSRELLRIALSYAVPLHAADLVKVPLADLIAQAPSMGQYLAEHGDRLMFRSKPGETREAFTLLAKAVAILAFQKGGVTVFSEHFEFRHPDGNYAER